MFCLQIGADGFRSKLRQTAGINVIERDYKQKAVVATVELSEVRDITFLMAVGNF